MEAGLFFFLPSLIFFVAVLYSSVGHGGASGYLAVLSFFAFTSSEMTSTALLLNVMAAGISWFQYHKARYFDFKFTWPFIAASVPAAFMGGLLPVSEKLYLLLLGLVLVFAAYRLFISAEKEEPPELLQPRDPEQEKAVQPEQAVELKRAVQPSLLWVLALSAGIGLLSGLVGVGGGIFLSPLLILFSWAGTKKTSATSAFFIIVNSLAGLAGRWFRQDLSLPLMLHNGELPLWIPVVAGVLGSMVGAYYGANVLKGKTLRKVLAVVLLLAAVKMLLKSMRLIG